jgi:carbon monoxide dehydrogenase subunit G
LIKIEEVIPVPAPPQRVWEVVSDPAQVVSCIHGAELGEYHEDGSFDGSLVVKFSAIRVRFGARLSLELDEPGREGRLGARGRDGQGATRFSAQASFRVAEDAQPGDSLVHMSGDVTLSGRLASVIEAGAGAVVSRMTREFTEELVRLCTAGQPAAESVAAPVAVPTPAPRPAPRPWWAAVRDWWRRTILRQQSDQAGSAQ